MTYCYKVWMRDAVGPFQPYVVAETAEEAVEKATTIAHQLFGKESDLRFLFTKQLHETGTHVGPDLRTPGGRRRLHTPQHTRALIARRLAIGDV